MSSSKTQGLPSKRASSAGKTKSADTAAHQQRTRQQHAQERAQDYVEAIADLLEKNGEARAIDLARIFGVTHVTVIRTIQRLNRVGHGYQSTLSGDFSNRSWSQTGDENEGPP